jgi:hypothetical protein
MGVGFDVVVVNGLHPERFSTKEADALRAAASDGAVPDPEARAALRAAVIEHERARTQRGYLRRLKREAGTRVITLPFLAAADVGLAEYGRLAVKLGRDLTPT